MSNTTVSSYSIAHVQYDCKLSVNGAEMSTLKGAARLFSLNRICVVMLHTRKMQRGLETGENYTRNELRRCDNTLGTSGEDSKRVKKM